MKSNSWLNLCALTAVTALSLAPLSTAYADASNAQRATVSLELNGRHIGNFGSVSIASPSLHKTFQYVPVYYVARVLQGAGIQSQWRNGMWALQSNGEAANVPKGKAANRQNAFISINGAPAVTVPKIVRRDKWSGHMTTYVRVDKLIPLLQKLNLQATLKNDTLAIVSPNMPDYGGQLQLDSVNPPPNLDPAVATDSESVDFLSQIYDTLVTYNDPSGKLEPSLAESYSVSADA